MLKHHPFGWLRNKLVKDIYQLLTIKDDGIRTLAELPLSFSSAYRVYEFHDGTPFGIKE